MQPLMPPIDSSDNLFHNGNPLTGEKGTIVTADFLNNTQSALRDVQTELIAVLSAAGLNPDSATAGQLLTSFKKLFLIRTNPFSDIAADGAAAISAALKNLGLGDGTALPVGIPVPWPKSTPPEGWITLSGQTITANQYPKLFALFGSKLPDLRGQFIRGWANDGSVDSGRTLLSSQGDAIRNITGSATPTAGPGLSYLQTTGFTGALTAASVTAIQPLTGFGSSTPSQFTGIYLDASKSVPTASENRPVNIAFNYIVRGI